MSEHSRDAIAIVGIGCRFPGGVDDPASFWKLLSEGRDAITEVPPDRIDLERYFDAEPATPGRMMSRRGGFLGPMEAFDAEFFGISPREAQYIDPQQRVLLEAAWEALEDAGMDVARLEGSTTAVYVGQWVSDFESRLFSHPDAVDLPSTLGSGRYATSGRISYALGFRGASLTIDSACSSSLVAVHLAMQALRGGETRLALAGGVNMILQPHITIAYSQSRMMAVDGHCKFGDASGDGYVRSEGAGLVALKRLDDALADGDRIYALVRGSAVNNDGRSSGVMGRPSRVGHEEMLRAAYRDAGVTPAHVSYVEAHGTGTRAGDPVEISALGAVLGEGRPAGATCLIGSVKTNIGHTEGAAGVAGLIKAALALHHGSVPASLHFVDPNPGVPWADLPFRIPTQPTPWSRDGTPRLAGVNSFGIGGTNAHVVLQEAPAPSDRRAMPPGSGACLLPLSAKSPEALRALAGRYAMRLASEHAPDLRDLCWSAATRRAALDWRTCFVASDPATMIDALRRFEAGEGEPVRAERQALPRIAFVVPGQGAQWDGMARQLMATQPVFREALVRCDHAARAFVDWSILEQLQAEPGTPAFQLDRIDVIQPVLVSLAIAYAALLESWGVQPDAVVGHSMGEVGAACIAGALDLDQAMRVVCLRSALMRRTSGSGAMALVELSMEAARDRIQGRETRLAVAVINSPRSCVISGDPQAVQEVISELERDQVFCRLVKVDVASHSPQMEPLARELEAGLAGLSPQPERRSLYSTVWARAASGEAFGASYWADNLRRPVLFAQTLERMLEDRLGVFVELGPHPVLAPAMTQTAQIATRPALTLACGHRDEPDDLHMLSLVGSLWASGQAIEWRQVMSSGGRTVDLPGYPWQRERHWGPAVELPHATALGGAIGLAPPDAESLAWLHQLRWEAADVPHDGMAAGKRWLLASAPAESASAQALATALVASGCSVRVVSLAGLEAAVAEGGLDALAVLADEEAHTAYLPVRAARALLALPSHEHVRLWVLTRGAQAVVPGEHVQVLQAAAWGSARVVAEEHPELWGGLIDCDPQGGTPAEAGLLALHLQASDREDQAALRGSYRYVLRLQANDARLPRRPFLWRADAAYLITGGLGGVALHVARGMVAAGARRLVLLARTPMPPRDTWSELDPDSSQGRRVAAVRELEALGAAVHLAAVDVADPVALKAFLAQYAAQAWPAIRGVVHAAGTLDNHLVHDMDRDAFHAVVAPKLRGAQLLDTLLPDLDLFVTFSSTGAFLAQAGQANYAAANAALDALVQNRRARGEPGLSVAWGVWADTGLVRGAAGERLVAEMARQGIGAFEPERGAAMFPWLCASADAHCVVLPMDWAAFARARSGRTDALYRNLAGSAVPQGTPGGMAEQLATAEPAERRRLMEALVKEAACAVLRMPLTRLDPRKALGAMGLNSLMAMELRNRLEAALGRSLSATLAWNYPTVEVLAAHLAGDDTDPPPGSPSTASTVPPAGVAPVAALSDEDALLALRGSRRRSRP